MTRYLLNIYQPDAAPPGQDKMDQVVKGLHELNTALQAA